MWKSRQKHDRRSLFYGKINIFRQINVFTEEVTKELISRNFLSVIAFYSIFPHYTVSDTSRKDIYVSMYLSRLNKSDLFSRQIDLVLTYTVANVIL